jgi:peptidoglycan-associated lipoprotein
MQLVQLLFDNENLVIELRSHTDSRASFEYNDILSQKRAQSVVDFLVSEGIDPGRLVAKGYGERIFRVLDKDLVREGYLFKSGTELNDEYINSLPTKEIKEAAYQLNRRTEFAVLAKDYKPGSRPASAEQAKIQVVSDSTGLVIGYNLNSSGKMQVLSYINDFGVDAIFDPGAEESVIDEKIVLDLLKKGAIDRDNFIGTFENIMVDGQITENSILKLDKVRTGEWILNNLEVKVKNDTGNFFIIGRDLIGKAGNFKIDENSRQIIFK